MLVKDPKEDVIDQFVSNYSWLINGKKKTIENILTITPSSSQTSMLTSTKVLPRRLLKSFFFFSRKFTPAIPMATAIDIAIDIAVENNCQKYIVSIITYC